MSLLFFDSFKNYTFLPLKWEEYTKNCQFYITEGVGRKSGTALRIYSDFTDVNYDHIGKKLDGNYEEIIIGFAFKKVKEDFGFIEVDFNDGNNIQSKIKLFNESFIWYNGDETINQGVNYCLQFNDWNYFEAKIKTHTVSGTVDIRINEYTALSLQNINTASTPNNYIDRIRFRLRHYADTNEDYAYIEDLYISDTFGDTNNNFLGNCEISTVYPISQGSSSQFELAPTYSGVENCTLIDEQVYQEDTTITYNNTFLEYDTLDDGYYRVSNYYNTHTTTDLLYLYGDSGIYFRFSGVDIPKNAKIITAKIQAYEEFRHQHPTQYVAYMYSAFQKSGTPPNQITSTADFKSRELTHARVNFWINLEDPRTKEYKESLQELVSRSDWQEEDNSILYLLWNLTSEGQSSTDDRWRVRLYPYDNDPYSANTPKLYVEWQLPGGDSGEYVSSDNLSRKDTYTVNTISGTSEIFAVNHNVFSKRKFDVANTDDMALNSLVVIEGTTYSGIKLLPTDRTYTCSNFIEDKNPATDTNWSRTDILNSEFGFVTTSSG